jgi:hypothetical protein
VRDEPFEVTQSCLDSGIELGSSFVAAALGRPYGTQQIRIRVLENGTPAGEQQHQGPAMCVVDMCVGRCVLVQHHIVC